jgi:UDP-glucose 4-epimerase
LIPSVIQAALGVKKEIVVYGTDFPSKDGSAVRDYIHVQDIADAHVSALRLLMEKNTSAQINLGTGTGHSVLEIVDAVQKFCGKTLSVRLERSRAGEPSSGLQNSQSFPSSLSRLGNGTSSSLKTPRS